MLYTSVKLVSRDIIRIWTTKAFSTVPKNVFGFNTGGIQISISTMTIDWHHIIMLNLKIDNCVSKRLKAV